MRRKRASTFVLIAIVALLMAGVVVAVNSTTIFQEGNPLPVLGGIWKLVVDGQPYARISTDPLTYITKTGNTGALFKLIEQKYGVKFQSQGDSAVVFEGVGKRVSLAERHYSRSFQIWEVKR